MIHIFPITSNKIRNNQISRRFRKSKNIKIVEKQKLLSVKNDYDIIINIFSYFHKSIKLYNQILKISKLGTQFVNILPFQGFINYSYLNLTKLIQFINVNKILN